MPTTSPPRVLGLVLAGGRSSRFGSDKAAALLDGRPLLHWALGQLDAHCAAAAVSARPGSPAEALARQAGRTVLHDAPGDAAGPLSGIKAGLAWAAGEGGALLAVTPCDAPLLPADLHGRLAQAIGAAPVAVAETADGPQPLCSLWRVGALPALAQALAGGAHPSVWRLADAIGGMRLRFDDPAPFRNANTPEALAGLRG